MTRAGTGAGKCPKEGNSTNTNPLPRLQGVCHQRPAASDRAVTVEKGVRALSSPSSRLGADNFSHRASPGCHRWKRGTVAPALPTAKLRLRRRRPTSGRRGQVRSHWLRRSTRTAAAAAPFARSLGARPTFALVPMATRQRAPGLRLPAAGGAEARPR